MTVSVVDLFSGGGGASAGFSAHGGFEIVGAADAQVGKPSSGIGTLACNETYRSNLGIRPVEADLGRIDTDDLADRMGIDTGPDVLIACPPCTGFSRTNAQNHMRDDERNALVPRVAEFARAWKPQILVMENARELITGRFRIHFRALFQALTTLGYRVSARTYFLNRFGLPQRRERAVVIATAPHLVHLTIDDLWSGLHVDPKATHVRRAIWHLPRLEHGAQDKCDAMHAAPRLKTGLALERTSAIPQDGGSWFDLAGHPRSAAILTPTMKDRLARGDIGSHPDVYGRMWWDRPAPTIKRECGHVGNGRYTHPSQDRLCSVREMGILNGFPDDYRFEGGISNAYRHIGDAVPPVFSFQLAHLCNWILGGEKATPEELILRRTHLTANDILTA